MDLSRDAIINYFRQLKSLSVYAFGNPFKLYKLPLYIFYKYCKDPWIISSPDLHGLKIVLNPDSACDRTLYLHNQLQPDLISFLKLHLKTDSVFFDIGSHSGFMSLTASTLITKGDIHAFEPLPRLYQHFKQSININRIKNITLNNICLGSKVGEVKFYVSNLADSSGIKKTSYQIGTKIISRKMTTLDQYCQKMKMSKIDLIKIDTEGSEKDILYGGAKVLKKFKPILVIEFSSDTASAFGYDLNEVYDFLKGLGYKLYTFKDKQFKYQKKKVYYQEDIYCLPN